MRFLLSPRLTRDFGGKYCVAEERRSTVDEDDAIELEIFEEPIFEYLFDSDESPSGDPAPAARAV